MGSRLNLPTTGWNGSDLLDGALGFDSFFECADLAADVGSRQQTCGEQQQRNDGPPRSPHGLHPLDGASPKQALRQAMFRFSAGSGNYCWKKFTAD